MRFKKLYGVTVPSDRYLELRAVANVLVKQTTTRVKLKDARKFAVIVALEAFLKMGKYRPVEDFPKLKGVK